MTGSEKGRIDAAEQAIVGLSGRMDGFDSRLTKVEQTGSETNEIAHKLLARQGGYEATRGMLPVSYVWSAVGLFVSLLGVGITLLVLFHNNIIEEVLEDRKLIAKLEESQSHEILRLDTALQREMRDLDAVSITRLNELDKYLQLEFKSADDMMESHLQALRTEFELRLKRVEDDVVENTANLASRSGERFNRPEFIDFRDTYFMPLEARVRAIESTRATGDDFSNLVDRVAALEVREATTAEIVKKAWDAIVSHKDELDHPIRQTFENEGQAREIELLRREMERIDAHGTESLNQRVPRIIKDDT